MGSWYGDLLLDNCLALRTLFSMELAHEYHFTNTVKGRHVGMVVLNTLKEWRKGLYGREKSGPRLYIFSIGGRCLYCSSSWSTEAFIYNFTFFSTL